MSTIYWVFNGLGLARLGLLTGLDPPAKNLSGYYPTYCDVSFLDEVIWCRVETRSHMVKIE